MQIVTLEPQYQDKSSLSSHIPTLNMAGFPVAEYSVGNSERETQAVWIKIVVPNKPSEIFVGERCDINEPSIQESLAAGEGGAVLQILRRLGKNPQQTHKYRAWKHQNAILARKMRLLIEEYYSKNLPKEPTLTISLLTIGESEGFLIVSGVDGFVEPLSFADELSRSDRENNESLLIKRQGEMIRFLNFLGCSLIEHPGSST